MRLLCILLLLTFYVAPPAYAELPNWKEGDVIKAELVTSSYSQGSMLAILVTPENDNILLALDPDGNCEGDEICKSLTTPMEAVEKQTGNDEICVLNREYYGRQLLITFKKFISTPTDKDLQIYIIASKVQLDTDKKAPRNTYIKPHKKVRGRIFCPREKNDNNTYIINTKNKKIVLHPMEGPTYGSFNLFCFVKKRITIEGDFIRNDHDDNWYFRTTTDPESFFTSLPKGY